MAHSPSVCWLRTGNRDLMHAVHEEHTKLDVTDLQRLSYQTGAGRVERRVNGIQLSLDQDNQDNGGRYSDAQLDDYHLDGIMRWQPPLRMSLRARFSQAEGGLHGTAGFGFWNDPFGMTKIGDGSHTIPRIRLPQAVWYFFASPPSLMPLAHDVPGYGWKAATIDAGRHLAKVLLPLAPFGMLACKVPWLYRRIWPLAQKVLKIDEVIVSVEMDDWHDYVLEWGTQETRFHVDGQLIFQSRFSPRGPLGFVAWIDNQYMVATPQGHFRHGVVATTTQSMELVGLEVVARA